MNKNRLMLRILLVALLGTLIFTPPNGHAAENLNELDLTTKQFAEECADEIVVQFNLLLTGGHLTMAQLFDTFYIPIPGTSPQKFNTQYDQHTDGVLRPILDKYLAKNSHFIFVVAVDRNGYLPTHNSRYSKPLTDDNDYNTKWNRTKRIFNDRTGLAAARNTDPYLLQRYSRDTGEIMSDLSVPVFIKNRHWGALRIGYK